MAFLQEREPGEQMILLKEQQIVSTVSGHYVCPECRSDILEVLRTDGTIEEYCQSWKNRKVRCKYFREIEMNK